MNLNHWTPLDVTTYECIKLQPCYILFNTISLDNARIEENPMSKGDVYTHINSITYRISLWMSPVVQFQPFITC